MTNTIEITALNGYTYRFIELDGLFGKYIDTYFSYKSDEFRQSCKKFNDFDEARAWVREIEQKMKSYRPITENIVLPDNYYNDTSRYYGD